MVKQGFLLLVALGLVTLSAAQAAVVTVGESVGVSDSPVVLPPVEIAVGESVGVSDSPVFGRQLR